MGREELVGSWDMHDARESVDLFAGVRMWAGDDEAGFSMNDGRGGKPESIIFTGKLAVWMFVQIIALFRRNAYRRSREYAKPNFRPLLRLRGHEAQVPCTACEASGFVMGAGELVDCEGCGGTGWMDPPRTLSIVR